MSDLTEYSWWGRSNPPPKNLKTKRQLGKLGLKPVQPVGVIHTDKYDCLLYDPSNNNSAQPKRKCSKAQLKALNKGRKTTAFRRAYDQYWNCIGQFDKDRINAVNWAKKTLEAGTSLILD